MIFFLTVLYLFHNGSCICKTAGNTDIKVHSFIRNCKFLDSLISTNTAFCDLMHGFFAVIRSQTAENCLCNTSCNTEDNTTTGAEAKRHITGFRIKSCKVKTKVIDHAEQLCSCNNDICILFTVCEAVRTNCFCLLGCTWHNRNHNCFLAAGMFRIAEVLFDYC